jgi:hypothetical protein
MALVSPNSPIHPILHERVSVKVEGQLPDFVKQDHPTFVAFLEAYYEYMEQQGKPIEILGNLQKYNNLDQTTTEFLDYFKQAFGKDIPEAVFANANKPFVLKHLRDFYLSKGSEKSFEFLFRLLHKEEIDFYYPSKDMLRVSDGKYTKNKILRVIDTSGTNAVFGLTGKKITGSNSAAQAIVELVLTEKVGPSEVSTIYLSGVRGTFLTGDQITTGPHTFTLRAMVTGYKITKPGNNYSIGNVIRPAGGIGGSDATLLVDSLTTGSIKTVTVIDGGSGYVVGDKLTVDNSGVKEVDTRTASFIVKEISLAGAVTKVEIENEGRGYSGLPVVGGGSGNGLVLNYTGHNVGGVKTLKIIEPGFGYLSNPTFNLSALGDGTATGYGIVSGYEDEHNVGWSGDDGFLSAGNYIQDSYYYQLFSYVITSKESINNWRDIVKRTVHPAGMALFGNVQLYNIVSTTLNSYTFDYAPKKQYKIIFHEGSIVPPVIVQIPVDSCEGDITYIFAAGEDYLSTLPIGGEVDEPNPNEDYYSVLAVTTSTDDWGLVTTATFWVAATHCQIYAKILGIQHLRTLAGLDDYLYLTVGGTRFGEYGPLTEAGVGDPDDWGNLVDETVLYTQLRLGPLRRKLDYWKFRTQGGYSQGVIGHGATADVDAPVAGAITSFSNLVGGTGYVNHAGLSIGTPNVLFDNTGTGGSDAEATVTVVAGAVTAINLISGGSGYTSAPTITIASNGQSGGTESGTSIKPFLNQLTFDWRDKGGLKQRNLTNAIITQWDHIVTPDITYGETTNSGFLTNVYGDLTKQVLPPLAGPVTLQWYQPGGNPP